MAIDDILENFELFDDWEDRYRFVIDLGRELTPFPEAERTEDNRVRGCTSRVWLTSRLEGSPRHLFLEGDSDAHIVKGLVAILLSIYSGKTPVEVLQIDARAILAKLGLEAHLSPMRTNGLFSMVERIRAIAADYALDSGVTA
ncbi:SufE family protein [Alphaproteobacteria bacterium LMG 31809]|uniref:SufE family protein n=2 Tax=Govanella unica TaxID=2975056 RepID=A0A9X3TZ18_9PROT|nr:SufE family protein [Govania unica]